MIAWWNALEAKIIVRMSKMVCKVFNGFPDNQIAEIQTRAQSAIENSRKILHDFSANSSGNHSKFVRDTSMAIFRSKDLQLIAAIYAIHRKPKKFPKISGPDDFNIILKRIPELAGLKEKIRRVGIPKAKGGFRDTYCFGPIRYIQQIMLTWILSARLKKTYIDYSSPNKGGIHRAAKSIGKNTLFGCRYWAMSDIKSAFPSVRPTHLEQLISIHWKLVRYIAFPILPNKNNNKDTIKATTGFLHRGLPQGGAHSSFILSCLIDGYFANIDEGIVLLSYADNLAIGAQEMDEAESALRRLQKVMANNLGGEITIHEKELRDGFMHGGSGEQKDDIYFGNAINFVGYRISVDIFDEKIRLRPSQKSFDKLFLFIANTFDNWQHLSGDEAEKEALDCLNNWAKNFPNWKLNEYAKNIFLCRLHEVRLSS